MAVFKNKNLKSKERERYIYISRSAVKLGCVWQVADISFIALRVTFPLFQPRLTITTCHGLSTLLTFFHCLTWMQAGQV